jgi:hypothetical protein
MPTPTIKMHPVISSNIAAAGYDESARELQIRFKTGATYSYFDVPEAVYKGIFTSESPGKFVKDNLVDAGYKYKKS